MANFLQGGSCSDELKAHVECAKSFLRAARFEGLRYEPGSYGEFDRCSDTRQEYVNCSHDPQRSAPGKIKRANTAGGPVQCELVKDGGEISRALSRNTGGKFNYDMPTVSGIGGSYTSALPKPCERELTHFGRCVGLNMAAAIQGGKGEYLFLSNPEARSKAKDKCFVNRTMFDQCAKQHLESGTAWGMAPSADKEGHTSRMSTGFARSFSTRGRTLSLSSDASHR